MSTPPPASPYGPYNPNPHTPYGQQLAQRQRQRQRAQGEGGTGWMAGEAEAVADAVTGKPVPPGSSHLVDAGQDFFGKLEKGVREVVDDTERATRGFGRRKRDARKRREQGG